MSKGKFERVKLGLVFRYLTVFNKRLLAREFVKFLHNVRNIFGNICKKANINSGNYSTDLA